MGRLFLVKLQEEGKLQKGDEVMVDGQSATVTTIGSLEEIVVQYSNGDRATLTGLELGADAVIRQAA